MDNLGNTQEKFFTVNEFLKKFIVNYIIGALLIGVAMGFVSEILSALYLPSAIQSIINFSLSVLTYYLVSSSAVKTSLKEGNLKQEDINPVIKKINIILIVLLVVNILFSAISSLPSLIFFSNLKNLLIVRLFVQAISTVIQYVFVMMVCKNTLEKLVLRKEVSKTPYIILIIVTLLFIASTMLLDKVDFTGQTTSESTKTSSSSEISTKYPNANWVKISHSSSTNVDKNIATVSVSFVNYEDTKKHYDAVRVICKVHKPSNNILLGESETYFEDISINPDSIHSEIIEVELSSFFVGNDFSSTIEVYGIEN